LASRYTRAWVTFIQELPFYTPSIFEHIEKVINRVKDHQAVVQISMIVDGFLSNRSLKKILKENVFNSILNWLFKSNDITGQKVIDFILRADGIP
jgi:hypothetical protein